MHRSSTDQTLSTRATRRTSARLSSRRSRVFDPLDFLAEVSAHIPDPHEKTTLMAGTRIARLSSRRSRTRGYRKQHGLLGDASPTDPAADESNGTPLEVRRSCLRRAFVPSSGRGAQARPSGETLTTKPLFDLPVRRTQTGALPIPDPVSV